MEQAQRLSEQEARDAFGALAAVLLVGARADQAPAEAVGRSLKKHAARGRR
jgi:hypothetical protein